jgi:hypothetical protein
MDTSLKAEDLWPLVQKLPHEEQVRLAKLALRAASREPADDAAAYQVAPPGAGEFDSDDEPLGWEAEGWENVDATR